LRASICAEAGLQYLQRLAAGRMADREKRDESVNVALQNVALPTRLRPPAPLSDDELMAFSKANELCKVERLASGGDSSDDSARL